LRLLQLVSQQLQTGACQLQFAAPAMCEYPNAHQPLKSDETSALLLTLARFQVYCPARTTV
jgi:hypothetical protein